MPRVLIVDDSPIVTKVLESSLSRNGFEVSVSHSPFGVSNRIREYEPHILLMDLGLPGLSGEKLLEMCRETGLDCYTIIISSAEESELQAHVSNGLAHDYYRKGAPIHTLIEKMQQRVQCLPAQVPAPSAPAPDSPQPRTTTLAWRTDLEIGVGEIDSQHKELFARFNSLLQACNDGKGREEVCGYLEFLHQYISTHFADEERLQLQYAYPGYREHQEEHQRFVADLVRLRQFLAQDGSGLALVIETNKVTISWLLKHIGGSDRALGDFLRDKIQTAHL